ncbi:hypothetical protein MtrunA17_Chr4g0070461 [Medicago truncatula]|uniref:RRM domain-containing protein n=2 Tax=Medicago truncatula TaxID=3880 RepID=A0A396IG35_MEDTR|nr:hypothetical protein MtrunA17_Chr4g0070461 [Medicago truncatula]
MFPSMDPPLSSTVPQEDFLMFHQMDRDLYKILVTNLSRDPSESMRLLAMWLWLEKVGFPNVVKNIMSLPIILINEIVDESMICLSCLTNNNNASVIAMSSYEANDIPLLQSLMEKEISLKFFLQNRVEAIRGVEKTRREDCMSALGDIMQQAMMRNIADRMVENNSFLFGSTGPMNLQFGSVGIAGAMVQQQSNNNGGRGGIIPADDRTLFVTFSKGYRVEEWEVKEFFSMAYGDCIETLFMQETQANEQPLFARIVFHKVSTIDMILRGASKVKFSINGKHVWVRKFVPKRANTGRIMIPGETYGFDFGATR